LTLLVCCPLFLQASTSVFEALYLPEKPYDSIYFVSPLGSPAMLLMYPLLWQFQGELLGEWVAFLAAGTLNFDSLCRSMSAGHL